MTRPERIYALNEAVKYIVKNGIPGCFVECGVWKGGSVMAMAYSLQDLSGEREREREIYLFDTFTGMVAPTECDTTVSGKKAKKTFEKRKTGPEASDWDVASIDEVRRNVYSTGYPASRLHFVKGKVEDTLPENAPDQIALLRLDTDFYESTKHELVHLFPRVVSGGVVILDDYGHWQGARKAVDEYLSEITTPVLLTRVDFAARLLVKP